MTVSKLANMEDELADKAVVVSGASRRIGLGIGQACGGQGAHVVLAAFSEEHLTRDAGWTHSRQGRRDRRWRDARRVLPWLRKIRALEGERFGHQ